MFEQLAAAQALLDRALVLRRILDRAARGAALSDWSLKRQLPDEGSSLAVDDAGYLPELGQMFVSEAAVYPAMSAAGNLVAVAELIAGWEQQNEQGRLDMHTHLVMTGCRVAMETAALTVWTLGHDDRKTRRKRSAGLVFKENQNERGFISCERKIVQAVGDNNLSATLEQSCQIFEAQDSVLKQTARAAAPNSTKLVSEAAQWIQDNPPPHAADMLAGQAGYAVMADRMYAITSGFVHGFKWATRYVRRERELLGVVADSLAAALIMTESAIALFEAQAQNLAGTQREQLYADLLAPTIRAWSLRYAPN